jgi:iron complex transport system substrate-binding protein
MVVSFPRAALKWRLPMPPHASRSQRIVSLAPSVTSILVALGAAGQLVGVTNWCPAVVGGKKLRGLARLGDCWALDVRAVERLRPTLVIGSVPYHPEAVAKLLKLPVPFLASNPRSLADIFREIRLLGRLVGQERRGDELIARMIRAFARIARRARRLRTRPRVYSEAWPRPRIVSPPWVAELTGLAGGRFVLPAGARTSDAEVARARPEVIVLAWAAASDRAPGKILASALQNPAWRNLPAVRRGRVHVVRDELLNTPGPPLMEGLAELFRVIHPGVSGRRQKATGGGLQGLKGY